MERKITKAILAAVTFVAAALLCAPTLADDYGPHPDLRAIYRDLPLIDARTGPVVVDGVVIKGNEAIAQSHTGTEQRLSLLRRLYDRWWVEDRWSAGGMRCAGYALDTSSLLDLAREHLPGMKAYPEQSGAICDTTAMLHLGIDFNNGTPFWGDSLFTTWWHFAQHDRGYASLENVNLRAPSEAESWVTRGGNSYFFFSADVKSTQTINVQGGTTIDVWFPFVLNQSKKYSLTIAYTDMPIGPIDGTLKDNTLHFVLPAFSVKPGAHVMGEIEGNPDGP